MLLVAQQMPGLFPMRHSGDRPIGGQPWKLMRVLLSSGQGQQQRGQS